VVLTQALLTLARVEDWHAMLAKGSS
jgi:hypothetical protein